MATDHAVMLEWAARAYDGHPPPFTLEGLRAVYTAHAAPEAARQNAQNGQAAEIAELRREISALRQRVAKVERAAKAMVVATGQVLGEDLDELGARVKELEQRPRLLYRGVWAKDEEYVEGDCVTCAGSMWIAKARSCAVDPRQGPGLWQLCVKAGRDYRPGKEKP